MSSSLVSVLHQEERSIVAELRASKPFQRLEALRRLLALYDAQPSVATGLDAPQPGEPDRGGGEVIHLTNAVTPPAATAPVPAASPPPAAVPAAAGPGPLANVIAPAGPAPAPQVAAVAEAAIADVVMRQPSPAPIRESEASSVVSSVRAALLGIGKG